MAEKKTKSNSKAKASSKGVVGFMKKMVERKPAARSTRAARKSKAAKTQPQAHADLNTKANTKQAKPTSVPNGKQVAPAPQPEKIKKKPPSITITRPEVTRPPVVLPPPRPLEAPIGAPNILVPKSGLPVNSLTPILRWMYVGGATQYEVEWSHDAHFGRGKSITMISLQTAITLDATHPLKPGVMYKWRVRGGNDAGWGPWSSPESFKSPEK